MRVGTKSILFGAHAFWLHPFFVALAWARLYGFPWDPRLWVAFFVHDLGYWGKPNMDGRLGESHPFWAARLMARLFDRGKPRFSYTYPLCDCGAYRAVAPGTKWSRFVLFHSRFLAKQWAEEPSRLCVADKLSIAITPFWLYYLLGRLSGEIWEYMALCGGGKYRDMNSASSDPREWFAEVQRYCREWVEANRDGGPDTMTPTREGA